MMPTRKNILITLGVLYLLPGLLLVWQSLFTVRVPFLEMLPTFLYLLFLWPLMIAGALFFSLAIPGFITLLIALILLFKHKYIFAVSLLLTVALLVGTLLSQRITINNKQEQSQVAFGWPIEYIIQDQSQYDPEFPTETSYYSALENPVKILWFQFFLSYFSILIPITLILLGIRKVIKSRNL